MYHKVEIKFYLNLHLLFCFNSLTLTKRSCFGIVPFQVALAGAQIQLKDLVCNASMLRRFLTVEDGGVAMDDLQTQLCNQPADALQEAERIFLSQLDFTKLFTVGVSDMPALPLASFSHDKELRVSLVS